MGGRRVSRAAIAGRVDLARELIVGGVSERNVLTDLSRTFGVSRRQAARYVDRARDALRSTATRDLQGEREVARERFEAVFHLAMRTGDLASANAAARNVARLYGLESPRRVEVAAKVETPRPTLSDAELVALARSLAGDQEER